jgi:hypothetical protein
MPKARIKNKLPMEIVVRADERHHTSVRKPRTHAYRRASEAPVSAPAVAVIRPVPIIIALPLFLCTLSGKRQLHAYPYPLPRKSGSFGPAAKMTVPSCATGIAFQGLSGDRAGGSRLRGVHPFVYTTLQE